MMDKSGMEGKGGGTSLGKQWMENKEVVGVFI